MTSATFRLLQHVPVGLVNVAVTAVSPVAAVLLGVTFLTYEVTQGNEPHRDIKGYCWGLAIGGMIWVLSALVS